MAAVKKGINTSQRPFAFFIAAFKRPKSRGHGDICFGKVYDVYYRQNSSKKSLILLLAEEYSVG
jgi:hypothetical protein